MSSTDDEVRDEKNGRRGENYNACLPAHLEDTPPPARPSISVRVLGATPLLPGDSSSANTSQLSRRLILKRLVESLLRVKLQVREIAAFKLCSK